MKIAYDFFAGPAPVLHARRLGERRGKKRGDLPARLRPAIRVWVGAMNYRWLAATPSRPRTSRRTRGDLRHLMHGLVAEERAATERLELRARGEQLRLRPRPRPFADGGDAGRLNRAVPAASPTSTARAGSTLALRATWRPRQPRRAHLRSRAAERRLRAAHATSRTQPIGCTAARRRDSRRSAATRRSPACTRRTPGRSRPVGARRSALRVERWSADERCASRTRRARSRSASAHDTWVSPKAAHRAADLAAVESEGVARAGRAACRPSAELYQGSISTQCDRQQRSEPEARALVDERVVGASASSRRVAAHDAVPRANRRRAVLADERHGDADRHEHPERRPRYMTKGLEVAFQVGRFPERPARPERSHYVRALVDRGEREFPRERGPVATASPGEVSARERGGDIPVRPSSGPCRSAAVTAARNTTRSTTSDVNGYTYTGTSAFIVYDARARYESEKFTASLGLDDIR